MRIISILSLLFFFTLLFSQAVSSQTVRAFPITDYMVDLNDSVKIVQIHPEDDVEITEKQVGVLKGVYRGKTSDTAEIGTGRCNLIKGDYYYFTIQYKKNISVPREGDLIYVLWKKTPVYNSRLVKLSGHYIELEDVFEKRWYDRTTIFTKWSEAKENATLDSMIKDIQFTGDYFLKENPSANVKISGGRYDGKMVLNAMMESTKKDLIDFLDYMLARPKLYAGNEWITSEIFATWLTNGTPTVK